MADYLATQVFPESTPQNEPMFGENQVKNNAGGYVYAIDDFTRLERFLVLGSEGGTFYVKERPLTLENAAAVKRTIQEDGIRAVNTILEFSHSGRIPKNSTALFALAMAASYGNDETQALACSVIPNVARTASHLFEFVSYVDKMRSWGRRLRRGVGDWYSHKDASEIAYEVVKYRNRNGWTHRDVLRSTHMKPDFGSQSELFRYIVNGGESTIPIIQAFELAQVADTETLVNLIRQYNLTWEMVPSEQLQNKEVWAALSERMPMTALFRNLATLTRMEVLAPLGDRNADIVSRLTDTDALRRARIHPIQALAALMTYKSGKSVRGSNTWTPVPQIVDALDSAVERAFESIVPTGKRFYLGVDVSGSMWSSELAGVPGLHPAMGAAVMASVIAKSESNYYIAGFSHEMVDLGITAKDSINGVLSKMENLRMGGTNCSLPMIDALEKRIPVDCIVIITDGETWAGNQHVKEALDKYRREMNIPTKLVVIAMTSTGFSIADPNDAGMLDVVGFDTSVPRLISDFVTH